ncbi:MAG: hypothetical protein AAF587_39325 [Bacteroidota bacterium]
MRLRAGSGKAGKRHSPNLNRFPPPPSQQYLFFSRERLDAFAGRKAGKQEKDIPQTLTYSLPDQANNTSSSPKKNLMRLRAGKRESRKTTFPKP